MFGQTSKRRRSKVLAICGSFHAGFHRLQPKITSARRWHALQYTTHCRLIIAHCIVPHNTLHTVHCMRVFIGCNPKLPARRWLLYTHWPVHCTLHINYCTLYNASQYTLLKCNKQPNCGLNTAERWKMHSEHTKVLATNSSKADLSLRDQTRLVLVQSNNI